MSTERPALRRHLVVPFGCKVSRVEARAISRELERGGRRPAAEGEAADLVVVHGCSVTARAERDARKEIRRLRREYPGAEITVSGCLARHAADSLARMPEVDSVDPERGAGFALDAPEIEPGRTRAFLKVQDGCERRCAYCVIPFLRGQVGLTDHYLDVDLPQGEDGPRPGSRFRALLEAGTGSGRLRALPLSLPSLAGRMAC